MEWTNARVQQGKTDISILNVKLIAKGTEGVFIVLGALEVTFEVVRDGCWPHFSTGQKIEVRLVHIFEMRDGKISKETVFDMGRPM